MLALLPYPKTLCIWSNTSSLEKSTNVQLGRNACNAVFQAHVHSAVARLHTVNLLLSSGVSIARPSLSWVSVPVHGWVSFVLVSAAVCRARPVSPPLCGTMSVKIPPTSLLLSLNTRHFSAYP